MSSEVGRDRVRERANEAHARSAMLKHLEAGVEHLVSLAHGHREAEPVARRGRLGRLDVVLSEPCRHGIDGLLLRRDEARDLRKPQLLRDV